MWDDSINQPLWQHVAPVICLSDGGGGFFFFLESRTIWTSASKNRLTVTEKSPSQSRSRPRIYSLHFRKLEKTGRKARPRCGKLLDSQRKEKKKIYPHTYMYTCTYFLFICAGRKKTEWAADAESRFFSPQQIFRCGRNLLTSQ